MLAHHVAGDTNQAQTRDPGIQIGICVIHADTFLHSDVNHCSCVAKLPASKASRLPALIAYSDVLTKRLQIFRHAVLRQIGRRTTYDPLETSNASGHELRAAQRPGTDYTIKALLYDIRGSV